MISGLWSNSPRRRARPSPAPVSSAIRSAAITDSRRPLARSRPDPERAASLLRQVYVQNQIQPQDMPSVLPPYANVHERFHPSFQAMIETSLFDDLYLVDRVGRVVYSLRKDSAFATDLASARQRDTPLAEVFREVMARLQQSTDPNQILVVSGLKRLDDSFGVLLARPVVRPRYGRRRRRVSFADDQSRTALDVAAATGLRFHLLDAQGTPISPAPVVRGERSYGPIRCGKPVGNTRFSPIAASWPAMPGCMCGRWPCSVCSPPPPRSDSLSIGKRLPPKQRRARSRWCIRLPSRTSRTCTTPMQPMAAKTCRIRSTSMTTIAAASSK